MSFRKKNLLYLKLCFCSFEFFSRYDDDADAMGECKKYSLPDLVKLEVGSEASSKSGGVGSFLRSPNKRTSGESSSSGNSPASGSNSASSGGHLMRISLREGLRGPLQFRSTRLRFFNNMAVPICKTEDMNGSLHFNSIFK